MEEQVFVYNTLEKVEAATDSSLVISFVLFGLFDKYEDILPQ